MSDSILSVRKTSVHFFSGTMISRIFGMVRDITLAFCFGTHEALAALFIAFRFSHLFRRLLGEGTMPSAFIPIFEEAKTKSFKNGCFFFRDLTLLWTLLLSFLCFILMGSVWVWYSYLPGYSGTREILLLALIMIPSLVPTCLFGLNASFLQAQKQYFTPSVAPVFFNIGIITSALLLKRSTPHAAMPYLSFGIVIACSMQWLFTFIPVVKACWHELGRELFRKIRLLSPEIRQLWKPLSFSLIGIGASQINSAIDTLFARMAEGEGPAHLWFSIRFQQLPLALFGIALGNALLPPLTRAIQTKQIKQFTTFLEYALRQIIALLLPCTAAFFIFGSSMIATVYGHGDFGQTSIVATTSCLQGYAVALVPMGMITILAPAFYAQKNYSIPMRGACFSLFLNSLLNTFFIFCLSWKATSITIATSISAWVNAFYLYYQLRKQVCPLINTQTYVSIGKTVLCVMGAACVTWFAIQSLYRPPLFFSFWKEHAIPLQLNAQIAELSYAGSCFLCSLIFLGWVTRANDLFVWLKRK